MWSSRSTSMYSPMSYVRSSSSGSAWSGCRRVELMPGPTINVLLVEDNPSDALLVREELAGAPGVRFVVTHVVQLKDALQRLKAGRFDVILSDLSLPDSEGMETFERLHQAVPGMPVI